MLRGVGLHWALAREPSYFEISFVDLTGEIGAAEELDCRVERIHSRSPSPTSDLASNLRKEGEGGEEMQGEIDPMPTPAAGATLAREGTYLITYLLTYLLTYLHPCTQVPPSQGREQRRASPYRALIRPAHRPQLTGIGTAPHCHGGCHYVC